MFRDILRSVGLGARRNEHGINPAEMEEQLNDPEAYRKSLQKMSERARQGQVSIIVQDERNKDPDMILNGVKSVSVSPTNPDEVVVTFSNGTTRNFGSEDLHFESKK